MNDETLLIITLYLLTGPLLFIILGYTIYSELSDKQRIIFAPLILAIGGPMIIAGLAYLLIREKILDIDQK